MINPLLRQLATKTLAGVPARDAVAASVALAEADLPFALLTVGFSTLEATVRAPAGFGASVAALLSVLIAATTNGDVPSELLRVAVPLAFSLALARVSNTIAEEEGDLDNGEYGLLPVDPASSSWESRLDARMRQREAKSAAIIDALVQTTRGLSPQKAEALKRCCGGRDPLQLSQSDWARCEGIGPILAQRVYDGLRQSALRDERSSD